jgi:hypothetical protein
MPNTYTPTATALPSTITEPLDGENRNVASVTNMTRAIANGVAFINAQNTRLASLAALTAIPAPTVGMVRLVSGFGLYTFEASPPGGPSPFRLTADDATSGGWVSATAHQTTLIRQVPLGFAVRGISGASPGPPGVINPISTAISYVPLAYADTQFDASSFIPARIYTGTPQSYAYLADLHSQLVDGASLASATLRFKPKGGHGALPTQQPALAICRSPVAAVGTPTNLLSTGNGFAVLAAASVVAYEVDQGLVYTPNQNQVIDKTSYRYWAIIIDEAGTNAIAGAAYYSIELSMTVPDARRS